MDVDLRIVRGAPDAEELAAVMAVLTAVAHRRGAAPAAAGGGTPDGRPRRAHWDRAWGTGFQPCGSWRERDRTVTAFDPGGR
ncbi:acyl-CoA carboxylase subunit epsilon [Streptomyces sp. PKU-MA01144]|uniref:acyl-CoA carboxylase subunit epsilon n=1 Tax=Streptomyces TaxID=1883 RepID=UPI0003626FAA|nr:MULTISPECIES: acyl-CoA carboxylase subunit epsilon [Streptomyces]MCY0982957.1 acyl-CoA carboxylase subunit epsilon [Streptomyces tirandamycinicus]NNJ04662.1 acyl-CoA carboxylase subunit epsilon [Streptomyces sp. PKU-MA01144]